MIIADSGSDGGTERSSQPRLAVRFVDAHSGRNGVLGDAETVSALLHSVECCLEGGRPGCRFPLLRLLGRSAPLSGAECEALVREVVRLRGLLAALSADNLRADAAAPSGDEPETPADGPPHGAFAAPVLGEGNGHSASAKNLAQVFAWPLSVLEHVGRLGAMGGRGARFETGPAEDLAATLTPLPVAAKAIAG